MHDMPSQGLCRAITSTSNCGDSLFSDICCLIATKFDVQSLWLYTTHYFCNELMGSDQVALHCLEQHLIRDVIQNTTMIVNWQGYPINMAMPYEKGKI